VQFSIRGKKYSLIRSPFGESETSKHVRSSFLIIPAFFIDARGFLLFILVHKIVPVITPFRENKLDREAFLNHSKKLLLEDGMDFVFVAGTTGLAASVSMRERAAMLELLGDFSERVMVQVGSLDIEESVELAQLAKRMGLHAIASLTPYFFPRMPQEWLVKYFARLSKIHPFILYNFPLITGYDVDPSLIKKINGAGGNVVGVKDTVPDLAHMLSFKWELGQDFLVYSGPDTIIFSGVRSGLDGAVAGSGNYVPELLAKAADPFLPFAEAMGAQKIIASLAMLCRKYGQWAANYSMVKILRGYSVGEPRAPVFPLSKDEEENLSTDVSSVYKSK
jgi:2-dehydro-3-deoxy-phosphogluconate/2-dehydro-3-deoxy-6-phosphogalactonate aldolase